MQRCVKICIEAGVRHLLPDQTSRTMGAQECSVLKELGNDALAADLQGLTEALLPIDRRQDVCDAICIALFICEDLARDELVLSVLQHLGLRSLCIKKAGRASHPDKAYLKLRLWCPIHLLLQRQLLLRNKVHLIWREMAQLVGAGCKGGLCKAPPLLVPLLCKRCNGRGGERS